MESAILLEADRLLFKFSLIVQNFGEEFFCSQSNFIFIDFEGQFKGHCVKDSSFKLFAFLELTSAIVLVSGTIVKMEVQTLEANPLIRGNS